MRRLRIVAVCGHGQGSSLVMRMQLENVIAEMGIDAILDTTCVAEATGQTRFADIIITTEALAKIIDVPKDIPLITVRNLLDSKEVLAGIRKAIEEHYPDAITA
ncbi:MAG: PTS sugar transporter subunit IIB [Chloroflexi bacterium]|nr:PTS sugar transporter subunit IIB [Chloroflexota bacterium]